MGVGMRTTSLENALVIHAVVAPVIFSTLSVSYFRRFGFSAPLNIAAAFLAVVITLDFFVVALFIQRSFDMFRSPLGTWFPVLLIFLSSWFTGNLVRRTT